MKPECSWREVAVFPLWALPTTHSWPLRRYMPRTTNKTSHSRPGYPESLAKRTMVPRMLSPLHQSATANHKRRPSPFIAVTHRYPVWRQNLLPRRRRAGEFVLHPLLCPRNQSPWTPTRFLVRPNPISVANPPSPKYRVIFLLSSPGFSPIPGTGRTAVCLGPVTANWYVSWTRRTYMLRNKQSALWCSVYGLITP